METLARERGRHGFSLLEILVVIAIIAGLSVLVFVALQGTLRNARDTKRISDLAQMGRFLLTAECYVPDAGAGDYDIRDVAAELAVKFPQFSQLVARVPQDPRSGTPSASGYRYVVTAERHCALYTNLEDANEPVSLTALDGPTPNGGTGVLAASAAGPNGTNRYHQIAK